MNYWTHKKFKTKFYSRYVRTKSGDRVFELVHSKTGRIITFESWQMAKKLGWEKVK
jgi:hypothetical protein